MSVAFFFSLPIGTAPLRTAHADRNLQGKIKTNFLAALQGAGLLLFLGLTSPLASAQERPPAPVAVDKVRTEQMAQTMPVIGRLIALRAGDVATRIDGRVDRFRVEVGDRVKKGDLLARLDSDRLQREHERRVASIAESQAALESEKASLAIDRQELRRLEALRESAIFPKARYEDKQKEVLRAQTRVSRAEAILESTTALFQLAELDLADAKILAPYDGVVTVRHTEVGAYVKKGDAVVAMVNDKNLEIEADVPAQRLGGIKPGIVVKIDLGGQKSYFAAVRAVVPEENPLTRTRRVRFVPKFDAKAGNLATNQSATIQLPIGAARQVVTVHKDAIIKRGGASLVFVAADGAVQIRPVALGEAVGARFQVLSGLKPGELVVTRGNERLFPGQKVSYQEKP